MNFKLLITVFSFSLLSLNAKAGFKNFEAAIDESKWSFDGNPLGCQLTHNIPYYGDAKFQKVAGKKENLDFSLGYKRQPIGAGVTATVNAIAPSWQPLQASRQLGEVQLQTGKHVITSQNIAGWKLLNELEIGRFPTFTYQEFNQREDQVSVALSSVGFKQAYDEFLNCLATLVPFKLNELSKMTLYFDFDRDSMRSNDKNKLAALAAYIRYDPSIQVVFINGHTDNKGSRNYNHKLSERRIQTVKASLSLEGVDNNRFKTQAFGEKDPIATNRNAQGRAKNRRVYIRIAQK